MVYLKCVAVDCADLSHRRCRLNSCWAHKVPEVIAYKRSVHECEDAHFVL